MGDNPFRLWVVVSPLKCHVVRGYFMIMFTMMNSARKSRQHRRRPPRREKAVYIAPDKKQKRVGLEVPLKK
jgi:hypothetical protein